GGGPGAARVLPACRVGLAAGGVSGLGPFGPAVRRGLGAGELVLGRGAGVPGGGGGGAPGGLQREDRVGSREDVRGGGQPREGGGVAIRRGVGRVVGQRPGRRGAVSAAPDAIRRSRSVPTAYRLVNCSDP